MGTERQFEAANNRSTNRLLTLSGVTKTVAQWSASSGISRGTIRQRIIYGWPDERILSKPQNRGYRAWKRKLANSAT